MDLGPHAAFIVTAYAIGAAIVAALVASIMLDYRRQTRALADLEVMCANVINDAFAALQRLERIEDTRREQFSEKFSGKGEVAAARMVSGQFEAAGNAFQLILPIGKLRIERRALHPIALAHCVVWVLHGERGERRLSAAAGSVVESGKVANQYGDRGVIEDDVMDVDEKHILLVIRTQQFCAQ